jgi:hypothetical protein
MWILHIQVDTLTKKMWIQSIQIFHVFLQNQDFLILEIE